MSLIHKTAHQLSRMLEQGETSSVEITQACLDRIRAVDGQIGAFIAVWDDQALAQAQAADERRRAGGSDVTALTGIPVAIKDNICVQGMPTTCASRMLENFRPPYDATVIERLKQAGCVLLGKTNLDEFAMGSTTERSAFHPTRNPWDRDRVPGGSSGGSAAAVAAAMTPLALGSDTGGSIRQPAAFCGVVGVKPTYGRVSRYGAVAFGSSFDQIGSMAIDVADAALLLQTVAGHDPRDSTSYPAPPMDDRAALEGSLKGVRIGLPREYFVEGMDPEIEQMTRQAVATMEAQGAQVVDISLPHTQYAVAAYYLATTAEASSNLARYDGVHFGTRAPNCENIIEMQIRTRALFGDEIKRRIMLGAYALSAGYYDAYYLKALKVRTLIQRDYDNAFNEVDLIAAPVAPTKPYRLGERVDDPLSMYLGDILTISLNLCGYAGLSVPCGFTTDNLPIGVQILAPAFEEDRMFRAAGAYERAADWVGRRPEL